MADKPVVTRWDPCRYSLIHQDDINDQLESLLAAASVPATIVNWAGDETPSVHEWCTYMGELTGHTPDVRVVEIANSLRGSIADVSKRLSITGPCKVSWRDGLRRVFEERHGDQSNLPIAGQSSKLLNEIKRLL
jgi:hypothetical protein